MNSTITGILGKRTGQGEGSREAGIASSSRKNAPGFARKQNITLPKACPRGETG